MTTESFRAFRATTEGERGVVDMSVDDLPDDGALVEVHWSSVNYKDGLASTPTGKVARISPLVPGVDLAGVLVDEAPGMPAGTAVISHDRPQAGRAGTDRARRHARRPRHRALGDPERRGDRSLGRRPRPLSASPGELRRVSGSRTVHRTEVCRRAAKRETGPVSELIGTRLIRFEGASNFRDLGGYRSMLGGEVRWGMVYRAGRLDRLTPSDLDEFAALGIHTVFDLRREDEREQAPDPVPNVHLCLMSKVQAESPLPHAELLVEHDHGVQFLRELYSGLLAHATTEIGTLFSTLAEPDAMPAVFHCAVGKDRTGLVAALLLTWLGVDREAVLDDFELTDEHVDQAQRDELGRRMADRGIGPEAAAGILGAPRECMEDALDELELQYGGIEPYLREQCGVDPGALRALRRMLLD